MNRQKTIEILSGLFFLALVACFTFELGTAVGVYWLIWGATIGVFYLLIWILDPGKNVVKAAEGSDSLIFFSLCVIVIVPLIYTHWQPTHPIRAAQIYVGLATFWAYCAVETSIGFIERGDFFRRSV